MIFKKFPLFRICLFLTLSLCLSISCNRKIVQKNEEASNLTMPVIPLSIINVPISIAASDINSLINNLIKSGLSDGLAIEEGYKLNARIDGDVMTSAKDRTINFLVPMSIEIFPKSNWNQIRAFGRMEIDLGVDIDIFQNQFLSKSTVNAVRWIEKPKLSLMGVKLPVEGIANRFVEQYKSQLTSSLDSYFNKVVDLDKIKSILKNEFNAPFYSSEDSIINVFSSPSEIALGPIKMEAEKIIFPVSLFFENVISSTKPIDLYNDLSFSIRPQIEESKRFSIQARIPMNYLELLVKESTEHQTFGTGITKINIVKLQLSGQDKIVQALIQTTGAYKGQIQLKFSPSYDSKSDEIELNDFSIRATDGKTIDKALFALIKGIAESKIKKELEQQLNNLLQEYKSSVQLYLKNNEIYPGTLLIGELKGWDIKDLSIYNQIMTFNLNTIIEARIDVLRLDSKLFIK
ncbi:MAG: DUF4403 family protein [Saprospiraceae bacterium]